MRNKRVAIIGRPNVGKSTLFNRLIQRKLSITSDISGTTRDRILHTCEWLGNNFDLIDTGGYLKDETIDQFQEEINNQIEIAIKEADAIVVVVSSKEGMTSHDMIVAKKIQNINKPIILAINKTDNLEIANSNTYEFTKMRIKEQIQISSIHGIGISNLLDAIVSALPKQTNNEEDSTLKIGIVGKPNVGKSTLINTILKDNRVIVSDIAGTTRDAIDTKVTYYQENYIFTDTAGLKKNKMNLNDIEYYSELRTNFTILNSDIILLMVDPSQEITKIDEQILSVLKEEYKPTIILINKTDLLSQEEIINFEKLLREEFKFFNDPYIINISALKNKKINKIFQSIKKIDESLNQEISIKKLNNFLIDLQMIKKPPRHNGISVKLGFITYSNNRYPHFIIFSNHPKYIHFSYERFIENNIKKAFNFKGIPLKISFKKK